jgi:hypothetical protein
MTDQYEDYKGFILSAHPRDLIQQLNMEVKTPLGSAQNIIHVLEMMQSPTPSIQQKIDSGELNQAEMLEQLTGLIGQVFDILDFYRDTLSTSEE